MLNVLPFFNAWSLGATVAVWYGYNEEVTAGQSTSRFVPSILQGSLWYYAITTLFSFFPQIALGFHALLYSGFAIIGALNYATSVMHKNQIARNQGEREQATLPFNLHKSRFFSSLVSMSTPHVGSALYLLFISILLSKIYIASSFVAILALGAIAFDQIYQRGWFPSFLQKPYELLRYVLFSTGVFGINSWLTITYTALNFGIFLWNFIKSITGNPGSMTCQFKAADRKLEFSFEKQLEGNKPRSQRELQRLLHIWNAENPKIRITYNHFRDSAVVTQKLIKNAPKREYKEFTTLFNKLNFKKASLRELILNEMAVHDKFHSKSMDERRVAFGLPESCDPVDIYIAFLKREMETLGERLTNYSKLANITPETQIMLGQSKHILDYLQNHLDDESLQETVLLNFALRTGSHCSQVYTDTFGETFTSLNFGPLLTPKEQSALVAQSFRGDQFKKYYYHAMSHFYPEFDPNEYHDYENFILAYGPFLYLPSQNLGNRYPDGGDLFVDWLTYYYCQILPENPHFSDFYNETPLIECVIKGKLHPLFKDWCESFYKGAYNEWVLDDDLNVQERNPDVITLAELMLLDFGMVELTKPLAPARLKALSTRTSHQSAMQPLLQYSNSTNPSPATPLPSFPIRSFNWTSPAVGSKVSLLSESERIEALI